MVLNLVLNLIPLILLVNQAFNNNKLINPGGSLVAERFIPPRGFVRQSPSSTSFGFYLSHLPLKKHGTKAKFHDGTEKNKPDVYCGVVDLPLGTKDLQQCADAVMRLRGEYLFAQKRFDDLHFNFLVDGKPRYFTKFSQGKTDHGSFLKYMDFVFQSANTASLKRELRKTPIKEMQVGDVFIVQGSPYGHAEIVMDMAINEKTGKKVYLLAQSYMPAQDIQILNNPMNVEISPWYELNDADIQTPEWTFQSFDLHRFKE